jgi:hypothetical protein
MVHDLAESAFREIFQGVVEWIARNVFGIRKGVRK